MKRNLALIIGIMFIAPVQATPLDTASWTHWTSSPGSIGGDFTQGSHTIDVTYSGNALVNYNPDIYDVASSFTSAEVTNTPGTNGTLIMTGGTNEINNLHFSQAVINPIIDLFSVGQGGVPVTFNFLDGATFSILSQGAGHWGGGLLTQSGSSVTGWEGNGLLQFHGTYTDISFITPDYEFYYGATVGAINTVIHDGKVSAINAVPEPATYMLVLGGLGLIAWTAGRRKRDVDPV
ncbi:MAG: PEP-CTERM sorting domain-containing protein [Nitrosospira sp.]|nr:PEP-CTERM sorting domain-containing protein [Nitrosospira sp.]MDN5836124.1 PEP-CTERM sorting domain-containing protein [Nitrosospira sp.]